MGIGHQRISGNTGFPLICFGKAAVYDQQFPAAFNGRIAFFQFHRDMSVDNMGMFRIQAKLRQDFTELRLAVLLHKDNLVEKLRCPAVLFMGNSDHFVERILLQTADIAVMSNLVRIWLPWAGMDFLVHKQNLLV